MKLSAAILNTVKHQREIRHTMREPDLHQLVAETVAKETGVDLTNPNVTYRVYTSSYQEGSLGTRKPEVVVEITVDLGDSNVTTS